MLEFNSMSLELEVEDEEFHRYFCKIRRCNGDVHFVRFCSDFLEEVDQGPV
jgi:hypothetical protein